jgi:excisionase family DNA binding protein
MTSEPYVDAQTVAGYLKIDKRSVLALTRKGKLPAHPLDATATRKVWRFKLSEVDEAIAGNGPSGALSRVPGQSNNAPGSPRSQRG